MRDFEKATDYWKKLDQVYCSILVVYCMSLVSLPGSLMVLIGFSFL